MSGLLSGLSIAANMRASVANGKPRGTVFAHVGKLYSDACINWIFVKNPDIRYDLIFC
jgi:hypothetical protein